MHFTTNGVYSKPLMMVAVDQALRLRLTCTIVHMYTLEYIFGIHIKITIIVYEKRTELSKIVNDR